MEPVPREDPPRLTIVVSSCDLFFDAWTPMFCLLRKFWPDCAFPTVVITNHLKLDPGPIRAMELGDDRGWGSNLLATLGQLESPCVIYIQEDHFLLRKVDDAGVRRALEVVEREGLDFLTFRAENAPQEARRHPELPLFYPEPGSRKGVFCDPCIWRREALMAIIADGETAWDFLKTGRERVAGLGYRRAQYDLRQLEQCPIHYMKRSGVREFLWHLEGLWWVCRHRAPVWPLHRGILLQSMHLRRALKRDEKNRWLRGKYTGFGVLSFLTAWQKRISMAHVRRHLAKIGSAVIPVHAAVNAWAKRSV